VVPIQPFLSKITILWFFLNIVHALIFPLFIYLFIFEYFIYSFVFMSFDVLVIDPPSAMHIATIMNTSLGEKKVTFGTFAHTPDTNPTSPA